MFNLIRLSRVNLIIMITTYVGLLNGIQRYLLPIALVTYGWSITDYGLIYFVQAFVMTIPLILGGYSTDLKGRKSTIIFSFLSFSVGVGYFSFIISGDSLIHLILAQVITTVSFGVTRMALSIQMADETSEGEERTNSLGLQAGFRQFAGFLGPVGFGYIFENYSLRWFTFTDFQVGFAILAIMGLLGIILSIILPETDVSLLERNRDVMITDMQDDQRTMQFAFGFEEIILGFTSGLIVPFITYYILTAFIPTNWQWGLLSGIGRLSVGIGSIIASRRAEDFGKGKIVIFFNLLVPILAGGIAFAPTFGIVSIFFVTRIAVANLIHPIWQSWYYEHISENLRGRTLSLIRVSRRLSRSFGSFSGSAAFTLLGPAVFPLGCLFYPLAMSIPFLVEKNLQNENES